jgi:sigma-54 specific flagellar transcriptional regulator A
MAAAESVQGARTVAETVEPIDDDRSPVGAAVGVDTGQTEDEDAASCADTLPTEGLDLRAHLYAIEHKFISEALERSGGTVAHAARLLGLRRTTLVEKLRKYGFAESEGLSG